MLTRVKEPFNALSHFLGVVLAIPGLAALIIQADGDPRRVAAFTVYGGSLILLYSASALFHGLKVSPQWEDRLRRFDHAAIFVLIAGSYTPVCLITLQGAWGWTIFAVVWTIAVAGICLKVFFDHLPAWASAAIYLAMGWFAAVASLPVLDSFPPGGLWWLVGGGLVYTAGAVIYALERPDPYPEVFGHHEIFHIFVLGGSVAHFVFMSGYVA